MVGVSLGDTDVRDERVVSDDKEDLEAGSGRSDEIALVTPPNGSLRIVEAPPLNQFY